MTAIVLRGDARNLPLPDGCVDLIVTSPPYFGLRSYTDGGEHYAGQIGSEGTPAAWLDALLDCTTEWVRVLKPEGNLFVNLGDKYSGNETGGALTAPGPGLSNPMGMQQQASRRGRYRSGLPPKSLMGLPWRYAIGCTDQLGLILRAEIVWAKPNGLPESVTDRVRRGHEQVFHFTKQPRYYAAVDEIREPHARPRSAEQMRSNAQSARNAMRHSGRDGVMRGGEMPRDGGEFTASNPLGKLPGSVWSIPSAPLQVPERLGVDHFAAFPPALVRPLVLGWSPPGVCTACGHGRRPVVERELTINRKGTQTQRGISAINGGTTGQTLGWERANHITGYACACTEGTGSWTTTAPTTNYARPASYALEAAATAQPTLPPTRPAVVLDPFGGTGTTALVASCYGRTGVTVDLSADYCRLAAWRVNDPGERARALGVAKPPREVDGQDALFEVTG
jgi:DNA modification methylase